MKKCSHLNEQCTKVTARPVAVHFQGTAPGSGCVIHSPADGAEKLMVRVKGKKMRASTQDIKEETL